MSEKKRMAVGDVAKDADLYYATFGDDPDECPECGEEQTGSECWRDYYMDGYTPAEAWAEDMSYADND